MAAPVINARRRRRGIALLVVLLITVLMIVIVYSFQENVGREAAVARNNLDGTKAYFLAQMALIKGQATLRLDEQADYDSLNEPWAQPPRWEGENFGAMDESSDDKPPEPKVVIADEERKFNLLLTVRGDDATKKRAQEVLVRLINICRRDDDRLELESASDSGAEAKGEDSADAETLVENLVRYLDERPQEDSEDLEMGAGDNGSAARMHKQTPFPMLTIGELLQVEGWTRELLYGPPRPITAEEAGTLSAEGQSKPRSFYDLSEEEKFEEQRKAFELMDEHSTDPNPIGIIPFITIYSSGQVNINTCPREVLMALDQDITWDGADKIVTAREAARKEIRDAEEEGTAAPAEDPNANKEDTRSFRTADLAKYEDFVKRVMLDDSEQTTTIEGFSTEVFTRVKPLLSVKSKVFTVLAQARVGKLTRTLFAAYRRTGANAAAPAPAPGGTPAPTPAPIDPAALPKEPAIKLTVLLVDYSGD
ncbi:MAG: general secretion pathway protein GspK [Planctomycetes bacterium]|nr:general secretion pathway protein GspK [Planctomycetota bacterium]